MFEVYGEGAADALLRIDSDAAAEGLDGVTRDGQAETGSFGLEAVQTDVRFKHVMSIGRFDAAAVVLDAQEHAVRGFLGPDLNLGPAVGGGSAFFGFLGGQWFPLPDSGALVQVARCIPSYWLTQAAHIGVGGSTWGAQAWIVLAVWTAVAARLAMLAYRRDTVRS